MTHRFEVLQEAATGLWFVVEENDHGWYVGSAMLTKHQARRRRRVLLKDFGMTEVRVVQGGDLFQLVDRNSRSIGSAYASESECRRANNLMDFQAMGRYAPLERKSSRFTRVLYGNVL